MLATALIRPRIYRSVYSSGSPHSIQDARPPDEDPSWKPSAPMMILMGEDDDWTPAPPCHDLAARYPNEITFVAYPGAYHDFDAPDRPVKVRNGAATTASGLAHVGTNEPARQDALARLPKWLEETH